MKRKSEKDYQNFRNIQCLFRTFQWHGMENLKRLLTYDPELHSILQQLKTTETPMPTNNAKGLEEVLDSLDHDARTLYDIASLRTERTDATREDVEAKAIALRHFQELAALRSHGAAIAELIELKRAYCECDGTQEAEDKAICALLDKIDELAALRQVEKQ